MSRPTRPQSVTARAIAARVLGRVLEDSAFASAALDAELGRSVELDARERALATELVYGVLRTEGALEARIREFAPRPIKDANTRIQLLIAAYQLLVLTRIPAFAAVSAAVSAVREERGERMAGFANAVLRKLAANGKALELERAIVESTPSWLVERLERTVGKEETWALLSGARGGEAQTTTAVRVRTGRPLPEWLERALPGRVSPLAKRVERKGDLRALPGYRDGAFVIQDEGSQVIALALGARPGDKVLDACAGRGQKTTLLREQVGPLGRVFAVDLYPKKLAALSGEAARLGLPEVETRAVDWTLGTGDVPDDFDRVLVDAPCSGTGTLAHRPEIKLRLRPEDPARLGELASRILKSASTRVRPGGRVVFAVCSVLPEEAEEIVASVRGVLEPAPFDAPELSGLLPFEATSFRLLPHRHGSDGYFLASFRRPAGPDLPLASG